MNALYECTVAHCRLKPKRHAFSYRVFMFSVDLDELPTLKHFGFSHNRFSLFSIYDRDHVDLGKFGGIRPNLEKWLDGQGIICPADASIRLVTFPRVLGYGFNPVSFYYIADANGKPLLSVAEVTNTFREMKLFPVDTSDTDGRWHRRILKNFYVSPFSDPGDEFDFKLGLPEENWQVNIDDFSNTERMLVSSVRGVRRKLTTMRLWWYVIKYPFMSLKIIALIHWHALLLWVRRVPFFRKTDRIESQLDVMRAHSSLDKNLP